jgi:hypothetical protein
MLMKITSYNPEDGSLILGFPRTGRDRFNGVGSLDDAEIEALVTLMARSYRVLNSMAVRPYYTVWPYSILYGELFHRTRTVRRARSPYSTYGVILTV